MTAPCVQYIDRLNDIANKNRLPHWTREDFLYPQTIAFVWQEIITENGFLLAHIANDSV